jgi:acetylornithine deacetylase/succinyl-diaminopimelate desuccinylase-like protein
LSRLSSYDFPVRLNETTVRLLTQKSALEPAPLGPALTAILNDPSDTGASDIIASFSPYYNAMMRTTCVATLVQAGHAENALPQRARATVNCRMLPDDNAENVMKTLKQVVADTGISVTCTYSSFLAPLSPLREDVVSSVEQVTRSLWPGVQVTPVMSTGATDGKYLRRAGIPVYGISGMFGDSGDVRAHGRDERIGVREFHEGVVFMYRFMKELTSGAIQDQSR